MSVIYSSHNYPKFILFLELRCADFRGVEQLFLVHTKAYILNSFMSYSKCINLLSDNLIGL